MEYTEYKNPWHDPESKDYGPILYRSYCKPTEYKGYLIFHRIDPVFDVVKNGICICQRAGLNGAKGFIDELENPAFKDDFFIKRAISYLKN